MPTSHLLFAAFQQAVLASFCSSLSELHTDPLTTPTIGSTGGTTIGGGDEGTIGSTGTIPILGALAAHIALVTTLVPSSQPLGL